MKHFLIAAALAFTAGISGEAQTMPPPHTCVRITDATDENQISTDWTPRYRATNNCPQTISFSWKHNTGTAAEGTLHCSPSYGTDISPGSYYVFNAGPLPMGIDSRIRWCSHYRDANYQQLTGYQDCHQANQPTCPPLR